MAELMKFTNGIIHWVESEVLGFMDTIDGTSAKGIGEDKMSWKLDKTKGLMVNAYYCMLVGSNDLCFTWKSIWKQKIPSLVAFFVWIVAWGRLAI